MERRRRDARDDDRRRRTHRQRRAGCSNAKSGAIRSLDASDESYTGSRSGARKRRSRGHAEPTDSAFVDTSYTVIAWRGVSGAARRTDLRLLDRRARFRRHARRVVSHAAVVGRRQHVLLRHRCARVREIDRASRAGELPPARVQVWHCERRAPIPSAGSERRAGAPAHDARRVARRVRRPWRASPTIRTRPFQCLGRAAVTPSRREGAVRARIHVRPRGRDVYSIDPATGKRNKLAHQVAVRRDGQSERDVRASISRAVSGGRSTSRRTRARISPARSAAPFVNMEDDHPVPERRAYGVAGFTRGRESAILYDRFDLWQVNVDGSSRGAPHARPRGLDGLSLRDRGRWVRWWPWWSRRTRRRPRDDAVSTRRRRRTIDHRQAAHPHRDRRLQQEERLRAA